MKSQHEEVKVGKRHRLYVGGMWNRIGRLQFEFLKNQGLKPHHCLLDIGCGCLRGGVHFIKYLDAGNYLGIEKEHFLIQQGVEFELGRNAYRQKKPEFVVSSEFSFLEFSKRPDYSIAQSLFTHLTPHDILACLRNLRSFVTDPHVLFATFFVGNSSVNRSKSDSRIGFHYSIKEMSSFGMSTGWQPFFLGEWHHPRNQLMMKYSAGPQPRTAI